MGLYPNIWQLNLAEELGSTHVVNVVEPLAKLLTRDQFSEIQEVDMDTPLWEALH
jgi:hypothetical protein